MEKRFRKVNCYPLDSVYQNWTYSAYVCWKNKCVCDGCNQRRICDKYKPMSVIPYGLKPLKYAVIKLKQFLGTEGLDERFGNENELHRVV